MMNARAEREEASHFVGSIRLEESMHVLHAQEVLYPRVTHLSLEGCAGHNAILYAHTCHVLP